MLDSVAELNNKSSRPNQLSMLGINSKKSVYTDSAGDYLVAGDALLRSLALSRRTRARPPWYTGCRSVMARHMYVQSSISLGQTGITLSYIVTVQQSFGWMVCQVAEVENDMPLPWREDWCRWTCRELVGSNSDPPSASTSPPAEGYSAPRFSLDSPINDEGSNLSIGHRSLARALRTILCIAHRLRTIIGYDMICVMDARTNDKRDTLVDLFTMPDNMFCRMCERSSITLADVNSLRHEGITNGRKMPEICTYSLEP
ncbi:hypothetical protein EDB19DRAFT_1908478 [Suillus lakei]|nr:hypothetical protein EDB19DRAFT_1908478 [Suillus lakei]